MPHPQPIKLVDPHLTLGTTPGTDVTCFAAGIHLLPEDNDDAATFCAPNGTDWTLGIDFKMSIGPESLDEALWELGGPGTVVDFDFAYTPEAASATNPHWSGRVRLVPWPVVDAEINGYTAWTMTMDLVGEPLRTPAVPVVP